MDDKAPRNGTDQHRAPVGVKYYKKDFWAEENLKYAKPHFRLRKVARVISGQARNQQYSLLDVGCGPGALGSLMPSNVQYYGIDISIPEPAQNLLEVDILENPIGFHGMKFDLVVAQGLFEYMGEHQSQKFAEIAEVLKDNGKFIVTYMNFDHRQQQIYWPYSNVQPASDFRRDLGRYFKIQRRFAGAHNWNQSQPRRRMMTLAQDRLDVYVPIVSPLLAVDFFYICSPLR